MEYPTELHNLHNDYPCALEQMNITKDKLSPYCKQIQEKFGISRGQVSKLVTILLNKTKYVPRYRNLQLYLELGLKLKKVPQHEKRHLSERNGGVKLALSSHLRNFTTHLRHVKSNFTLPLRTCVKVS